jgi:hypothetical protein
LDFSKTASELKFAGFNEISLSIGYGMPRVFERRPNILTTKLDLLFQLRVSHNGLTCELVVIDIEFNPLASFFGKGSNTGVELVLALAEDVDIFSLSLLFEHLQLSFVHFITERLECAACLSHDDGSEDEIVLELECTVQLGFEVSVCVKVFFHGEFSVVVLLEVLFAGASPNVA